MNKLLFVVNVDWFFASHRLPIALAARAAGYEVHVATTFTDRREALAGHGFVLHDLPMERGGIDVFAECRYFLGLLKLLRKTKPDVVHFVTVKPVVLGGIAARLAGTRAVVSAVSGLGFVFLAHGVRARLLRLAVVGLYRLALGHHNIRVVFQNASDRDLLVPLAGVPPEHTLVLRGSGVDLARFTALPFPHEPPVVVVFAARLLRDKGLLEFVQAARLLRGAGVPAVFRLAGAPDAGNRASVSAQEVDTWRREGFVEPLGHREDMPNVLASAHLVVLPSYREGLPKVLAEAAASGRPVVTTDVPGCRDAVEPGVTGMLVPVRDARGLAAAMLELIEDRCRREAMGAAGRRLAEAEFSVEDIVKRHLALYRELVVP